MSKRFTAGLIISTLLKLKAFCSSSSMLTKAEWVPPRL